MWVLCALGLVVCGAARVTASLAIGLRLRGGWLVRALGFDIVVVMWVQLLDPSVAKGLCGWFGCLLLRRF